VIAFVLGRKLGLDDLILAALVPVGTREQILRCYPQFPEFLRLKRQYDPEERFQSDWYRHHVALLTAPP